MVVGEGAAPSRTLIWRFPGLIRPRCTLVLPTDLQESYLSCYRDTFSDEFRIAEEQRPQRLSNLLRMLWPMESCTRSFGAAWRLR
jgi:hypothetical protein